jgi:GT2 family glycosyltransferase
VKNQIQSDPSKKKQTKHYRIIEDQEVICVDGFWFCSRKDVFNSVAFDSHSFSNFHFYDLDISMQIHEKGYVIQVISDVIIEHSSGGRFDGSWLESAFVFYRKWKNQLPATVRPTLKKKSLVNVKAYRDLLYLHKKNHYPISKETLVIGWKTLKFNIITAFVLVWLNILRRF